ncbi:hypothetical protein NW759_017412 [Fusarium solani]|nr:hypothetical protein NW759_017412 [Fusarium solani]
MAAARPTQRFLSVADDVLPIRDEERPICEEWLRSIGFLAPGQDQDVWDTIVQNWEQFLKATKTRIVKSGASRRFIQGLGAKQRERIKQAFWERVDGLEGLSERWPVAARQTINKAAEGPDASPFESLAAIWDLDKRRRYQSIWTSLICFLVWSIGQDVGSLEEMGLELDEKQKKDIMEINLAARLDASIYLLADEDLEALIQGFLTSLLRDDSVVARRNPLLWWTAVLVRSSISGEDEEDFISRGTISMNMLPPDVSISDRVEAIGHYSKVLILDSAFTGWRTGRPGREAWGEEIARDLNMMNNEWFNQEGGQRPDDRLDRRTCQSTAWRRVLEHIEQEGSMWLGQKDKTTMGEVRRLLSLLRGVGN